ncbi:MAG: PilZ domain-containing protein [Deltaproteobacteria bacterium]|nr:PilZ domain-containing protein [Deltaproteobacteria bacterium]MBK8713628.1 PilZ domain-containing protein [Deltaproteobacteria bacterium]MBP7292012.1 PilZ domain-containing protein [Nannocystaceae bacterium]
MADRDDEQGDRRRAQRVPINAEFGALPETTYVSDLSEHGVFVHTSRGLPVGTAVTLRFTVLLDDPVVLEASGRVVRRSHAPAGLGIAFTELRPEMALRLQDVITRQRPRDIIRPLEPAPAKATTSGAFRRVEAPPASGQTRVTKPPLEPPGDTKVVSAPVASGGAAADSTKVVTAPIGPELGPELGPDPDSDQDGAEPTKVATAPAADADLPRVASPYDEEAFEAHQTLVKLEAVDLEILDEDDDFDHDAGESGPRRR